MFSASVLESVAANAKLSSPFLDVAASASTAVEMAASALVAAEVALSLSEYLNAYTACFVS